ncbi:MAG: DUF1622 domain-containing protein [Candidatus Magasanikbacteria bacterium]|nr:DUF1622 domain-containing protein [Candidatus Magasanikbacteria bacterium]
MFKNLVETMAGFVLNFGLLIEYIAIGFIVISVLIALGKLPMKKYTTESVRRGLARKLIFGLELIIAADVLLVTVAKSFDEIIQLGAIVLIRIMLGYALRKEVAEIIH